MEPRRGPLTAGEKVQFTDRKGKKITDQLVAGGSTQTEHGLILHDDVIGKTEGTVILTVHAKREAQVNQVYPEKDKNKPWKSSRAIGGWEYAVMRPRLADYVLSMPRGAQIMYPKDIAQVIQLGDIRSGMRVLESGAGSGAMSVNLLNLGLSPASIVIMGSNKPFDEWQVHSGELLAVINVKDFD